jgi:hypothetical protein
LIDVDKQFGIRAELGKTAMTTMDGYFDYAKKL